MSKILLVLLAIMGLAMMATAFVDGALAVLVVLLTSCVAVFLIRRYSGGDEFPTSVFLLALLPRLLLGLIIYTFDLMKMFGPDALAYDGMGQRLAEGWMGLPVHRDELYYRIRMQDGSGWLMNYLVGAIYLVCGRSILVAQSFCAVIGAATAPMVYFCAQKMYGSRRVATVAAVLIAVFPAFVIWSSQLLKDGLIIFLLVTTMTMVLHLQKQFSYSAILVLVFSLAGIISLRFYIFYMAVLAIAVSFVISPNLSFRSVMRNVAALAIIGLALAYLGITRSATTLFDTYGNLERVEVSRADLANSAESGFEGEVDVSTTQGAIAAIPMGIVNLMLTPFPWQVKKWNQVIVLPEMFVWWAMIPILISGLWYTLKNKLLNAMPTLIFVGLLTVAYAIFQGNIGMAYRQRTQIQVFLFIFVAVGVTIWLEKREDRKLAEKQRKAGQFGRRNGAMAQLN